MTAAAGAAVGIHDHPTRKLGKRPPIPGRAAIPFSVGMITVPPHPIVDTDADQLTWPMDGNDRWGDCVVAGYDHFTQVVTALLTGTGVNLTTEQIVAFYRTQNPSFDPNNYREQDDQGMVIQLFLEYLQRAGLILGFAKIDHSSEDELKAAIYLGLGIVVGATLTAAQRDQDVWRYVPGSPEWGGHCFTWVGYAGTVGGVTWGRIIQEELDFIRRQVDEAWFVITDHHLRRPAFRASYDLSAYAAAFETLTGRPFPAPVPPPPTPPGPDAPFLIRLSDVDTASVRRRAAKAGLDPAAWIARLVHRTVR